jgi:hypothetical protein
MRMTRMVEFQVHPQVQRSREFENHNLQPGKQIDLENFQFGVPRAQKIDLENFHLDVLWA